MQLRPEALDAHLAKTLAPVYAVHGDEPLLALEAADAVRAAARKKGFTEREVFEAARGFDWSAFRGSLGSLSTVIAKHMGNITNLKITNRTQQFFEMLIDIEVRDVKHLTNIIAALRATPAINSVERARG